MLPTTYTAGINLVEDVIYVMVSQRNSFHSNRASEKRDLWSTRLKKLSGVGIKINYYNYQILEFTFYYFQSQLSASPRILLSHELEMEASAWTISPLIPLYVASGLKNTFNAAYPILSPLPPPVSLPTSPLCPGSSLHLKRRTSTSPTSRLC